MNTNQTQTQTDNKKMEVKEHKILDKEHNFDDQKILDNKIKKERDDQEVKNKIEKTKLLNEHEKIVEELNNVKDNNILNETITDHQPTLTLDKPMNHSTILNDSFVIIFSLFDEDNYEEFNTQDFVQSIIDNFYNCITTNRTDIYTFYVSIKEFCTSIDDIDIQLVIFTLDLIKMNYHFIDVLNKSNKIEYIRIIFNEFVKIIDELKLFL